MLILVDYFNIDELVRSRGCRYITDRVLSALGNAGVILPQRADFKLYGGWFTEQRLSKTAQTLSVEISRDFPFSLRLPTREGPPTQIIVNCQLNYSLAATNNNSILHNTLRSRPFTDKLSFTWPPGTTCAPTTCRMSVVSEFFNRFGCPGPDCNRPQSDFIRHTAQKMVDTMLTSDLIYWAYRPQSPQLAIVSSDDDMWPGIRTAIAIKPPIIQIHTKRSPGHAAYVGKMSTTSYVEINL